MMEPNSTDKTISQTRTGSVRAVRNTSKRGAATLGWRCAGSAKRSTTSNITASAEAVAAKGSRKSSSAAATEPEATNAASAPRDYAQQDFANDLFSEEDGAPVPDEIALKNLLKRQKQRLAAIREQPGDL